jgi:stage II sporulation protein E
MKTRLGKLCKNVAVGFICFFMGTVKLSDMFILAPGIVATLFGVTGKIWWPAVCTLSGVMTGLCMYEESGDIISYDIAQKMSLGDTAMKYILILSVMCMGFSVLRHKSIVRGGTYRGRRKSFMVISLMMVSSVLTANAMYGGEKIWLGVAKGGAESLIALLCVVLCYSGIELFLGKTEGYELKGRENEEQISAQVAVTGLGNLAEDKVDNMVQALKRLEFTFAGHDLPGISPRQMGQLLSEFKNSLLLAGQAERVWDSTLSDRFLEQGLLDSSIYICKNADDRNVYYVTGRTGRNRVVTGAQVSKILERYFHRSMRLADNSQALFTWEGQTLTYEESAAYKGEYFVRRLKKCGSPISGDNFAVREYDNGRLALMLSDGMGSGSLASCESCMVLDIVEELLDIGFSPEYCIEFANESMSQKNQGRIFSTFDMCVIDLYKGTISSYKQGAATTYLISREREKNKITAIESTTLPVGVLEKSEFDFWEESLEDVNAVVMVSDGLDDMDRADRLMEVLKQVEIGSAKNLVNDILEGISIERNTVIRDDVTVIATVILKMK